MILHSAGLRSPICARASTPCLFVGATLSDVFRACSKVPTAIRLERDVVLQNEIAADYKGISNFALSREVYMREDVWAAHNIEFLRAHEGEARYSVKLFISRCPSFIADQVERYSDLVFLQRRNAKAGGNWRTPRKPLRPAASSGTVPTRDNPGVTRPGIEPGSPRREASSLTARPPRPGGQGGKISRRGGRRASCKLGAPSIQMAAPPCRRVLWACESRKWSDFTSVRQPMEDRSRLECTQQCGDKIDVKHVYTEVDFAIGSQFIKHALDDSELLADLDSDISRKFNETRYSSKQFRVVQHFDWLKHFLVRVKRLRTNHEGSVLRVVDDCLRITDVEYRSIEWKGGRSEVKTEQWRNAREGWEMGVPRENPTAKWQRPPRFPKCEITSDSRRDSNPFRLGGRRKATPIATCEGTANYTVAERLPCSPPTKANRVLSPARVTPGFSHVGIVPDDVAGRWVFSGISLPPPLHSGAAAYLISPSSALTNSIYTSRIRMLQQAEEHREIRRRDQTRTKGVTLDDTNAIAAMTYFAASNYLLKKDLTGAIKQTNDQTTKAPGDFPDDRPANREYSITEIRHFIGYWRSYDVICLRDRFTGDWFLSLRTFLIGSNCPWDEPHKLSPNGNSLYICSTANFSLMQKITRILHVPNNSTIRRIGPFSQLRAANERPSSLRGYIEGNAQPFRFYIPTCSVIRVCASFTLVCAESESGGMQTRAYAITSPRSLLLVQWAANCCIPFVTTLSNSYRGPVDFDTFWIRLVQFLPSTVTADNHCEVDIGLFVHTTVESSLKVIEHGNNSGLHRLFTAELTLLFDPATRNEPTRVPSVYYWFWVLQGVPDERRSNDTRETSVYLYTAYLGTELLREIIGLLVIPISANWQSH
ncbi:hypothetical protein PR048_030726 [Dryococelus australis]|uniref:Uncharacterized protein n=1 Tax=Dryococelus australis TaxID=614101 RepID=A0ABQ9GCK1_9NEOP|nr:hypothetical protein PR048_030726 [Dryococelus australis]